MKPKLRGAARWAAIALAAHTGLVLAVVLETNSRSAWWVFRRIQETLDFFAYHLWWSVQNRYYHQIGMILYPLAERVGINASSQILFVLWYTITAGVPYALIAACLHWLLKLRSSSGVSPLVSADTDAK